MAWLDDAIAAAEQELEAVNGRRDELDHALVTLRKLAGTSEKPARAGRPRSAKAGKTKARRIWPKKPGAARAGRLTVGDLPGDVEELIVKTIRPGVWKPAQLAKELRMPIHRLRKAMKPLIASGRVQASGSTANREFSVPSGKRPPAKVPPKEGP